LRDFERGGVFKGDNKPADLMKCSAKQTGKNNMKTRNLLMTLGVAALTTMTFNAIASDAFLSPRAAGNQITRVAGVNSDANPVKLDVYATTAPRTAGNQVVKVAGTNNGATAATCSNMAGTPKVIAECASHPSAPMPCCAIASAK
jgi:hypothetical protein